MMNIKKYFTYSLIVLIVYLLIKFVISYIALSSIAVIELDAEIDKNSFVSVFYSPGIGNSSFTQSKSKNSDVFVKNERLYTKIRMNNHVGRKIRIDINDSPAKLRLYTVSFDSYFGEKIVLDHEQIYKLFKPNKDITYFQLEKDCVVLYAEGIDPYLVLNMDIKFKNELLEYFVPFVFSLIIILLATSVSFRSFPAVRDIHYKKPSIGSNYAVLDGIRGVAALFVLCEHTGVLKGVGPLGVWLFFSLSGFLLASPFIHTPKKAVSLTYLKKYTVRRVMRIVPMYYTFITIYFLFRGHEIDALRHYLFLQGDMHLWTIPQEMLFYLILPIIMFIGYNIARGKKILFMVYILVLILLSHKYLNKNVVSLYAYGDNMVFQIKIFLSGVFFSYFYHWFKTLPLCQTIEKSFLSTIAGIAGVILTIVLTLSSAGWIENLGSAYDTPATYGFLSGMIIFLILISAHTKISMIFSFLPLRAVGIVGFSFYLLHPLVVWSLRDGVEYLFHYRLGGWLLFFAAGVASYIVAALTYSYIERPFLRINSTN